MSPERARILGVGIDRVDLDQATRLCLSWIRSTSDERPDGAGDVASPALGSPGGATGADGQLKASPGRTRFVATPNAEMIVRVGGDQRLGAALEEADLAVADGIGVVLAARLLGTPLPAKVAGADLVQAILSRGGTQDSPLRVFLLGASEDSNREAAARLASWPGVRVAGRQHGYFAPAEEGAVVERIRATSPDLLLVGLGVPAQELFIHRHRDRLGARVAIGVGGVIDVLSGRKRRAPEAWRRLGLEWLYYLLREPSRWRRQLALPYFLWRVLVAGRSGRGQTPV